MAMQRRVEVDAVRGLMLVWMTLPHLPTVVSTYVNQPFGFVSGAEGFIFLSAMFTGRIYFLMAQSQGDRAMTSQLWTRTLRLYIYHVTLLALAFLLATKLATGDPRPGLHNLLDFSFAAPRQALMDATLLIYRPPLLDILPMYITFLVLTPVLLTIVRKAGWKLILFSRLISFSLSLFFFLSLA